MVTDKVLLDVTGSREGGNPVCSCSGVEVSGDLQVVKIFMSVMTDDIYEKKHIISRMQGLEKCASESRQSMPDCAACATMCTEPRSKDLMHHCALPCQIKLASILVNDRLIKAVLTDWLSART